MGPDFVVRDGRWVGRPAMSFDKDVKRATLDDFTECARNAYRVLLTRGMKGCYVYCTDDETRAFIESRL